MEILWENFNNCIHAYEPIEIVSANAHPIFLFCLSCKFDFDPNVIDINCAGSCTPSCAFHFYECICAVMFCRIHGCRLVCIYCLSVGLRICVYDENICKNVTYATHSVCGMDEMRQLYVTRIQSTYIHKRNHFTPIGFVLQVQRQL